MALNPYTLYHLYEKGILDCVPADLTVGTPVVPMISMPNSYLDTAQQGDLYHNHGMNNDTFEYAQRVQSPYANQSVNPVPEQVPIGVMSQTGGMNTFNGVGIGGLNQTGGMNTFGGVEDVQNGLANGYNRTMSVIDRIPKFVLGLAAATIGILALKHAFKGGKVFGKKNNSSLEQRSFWSKLNPMNWSKFFKKS